MRRLAARLDDRAWFVVLTVGLVGFYVLLRAPVLDPPGDLDPWYYTAAFKNFDFLFRAFPDAYYLSRLPWIIPGIAVNAMLGPVPAFFVLHGVFFVAGGLFAFLLFRRFFGSTVALVGYAALMVTPLFYDAYSNDYPDGASLTFLLGGAYLGLAAGQSRWRWLRYGFAGVFLAAAVGTTLFSLVTVAGIVLAYLIVFGLESGSFARALRDIGCAVVGALVLVCACGAFAVEHGGRFLFFVPSIREAQNLHPSTYKAHGYEWMKSEPQLLLPLFCLVLLVVLLARRMRRGWRNDPAIRFCAAAGVLLAFVTVTVVLWEFADTGYGLETPYYFSAFNIGIGMTLASVLYLLLADWRARDSGSARALLTTGAIAACALPTYVLYGQHRGSFGEPAVRVTLLLMALGLVAVGLTALGPLRAGVLTVPLAVLLLVFTTNYAGASGLSTRGIFGTTPATYEDWRGTLSLAEQPIGFMKEEGLQQPAPAGSRANPEPYFWYDSTADVSFTGMQSTYFWGYTWVGLDLPHVDANMRGLIDSHRVAVLVLLCLTRDCSGARAALVRAGYANTLIAARPLVSGDQHTWVLALRLVKFSAGLRG